MPSSLLDHFIDLCDGERFPPHDEVNAACERLGVTVSTFMESFAIRVAERYAQREMSFDRADALMNDAYAYYLFRHDLILPGRAWDIYLAFDAGEYPRKADPPDLDPPEKYTRPEIETILAEIAKSASPTSGG